MTDTENKDPCCHIINFEIDDDDSSRLTVRVKGAWFYLSIDPSDLASSKSKKSAVADQYGEHIAAARAQMKRNEGEDVNEEKPKASRKTTHSNEDSGYASEDADHSDDAEEKDEGEEGQDAEMDLQNWMLEPMSDTFEELCPADKEPKEPSLTEWYRAPAHFYKLVADSDFTSLKPESEDDIDTSRFMKQNIAYSMSLPQYLRKLDDIPWYSPDELTVVSTSHDIHAPIHPTVVRSNRSSVPEESSSNNETDSQNSTGSSKSTSAQQEPTTHFLKLSSPGVETSVTREIRNLHHLQRRLDKSPNSALRIPRLTGLVTPPHSPNSRAVILGFLLTPIPQPVTPLIEALSSSIPEKKREGWAKQCKEMVEVLHENGVIWGDAKADNFCLDGEGKLWMIDLGGGYTEGWVEPEKAGTIEGDDIGVERIIEVIRDPEGLEEEEEEEEEENEHKKDQKSGGEKRKRDETEEDQETGGRAAKAKK